MAFSIWASTGISPEACRTIVGYFTGGIPIKYGDRPTLLTRKNILASLRDGDWVLLLSQPTSAPGIRTAAKTPASWPFVPSPGNKKTGMYFLQTETRAASLICGYGFFWMNKGLQVKKLVFICFVFSLLPVLCPID